MTMPMRPILPLVAAVVLAFAIALPATAGEYDRNDPFGSDELTWIPIEAKDGHYDFRQAVLKVGPTVHRLDTADKIKVVDQNRVRLRDVPLVGGLFQDRLRKDDFTPRHQVGTAWRRAADRTLFVDLSDLPPATRFAHVAVVNQQNAYLFMGAADAVPAAEVPGVLAGFEDVAVRVGTAYLRDGQTLLVMIRPSIVTDSLF